MAYRSREAYLNDVTLKLSGYLFFRDSNIGSIVSREVCKIALRMFVGNDSSNLGLGGEQFAIDDKMLEGVCARAAAVPSDVAQRWAEEDFNFDLMIEAFRLAEKKG